MCRKQNPEKKKEKRKRKSGFLSSPRSSSSLHDQLFSQTLISL
jgi:hypothetical protein